MTTPLTLFASYAHKDGRHRDALGAHLAGLERQGILREWHDGDIVPGSEWNAAITEKLEQAEIIVLLISADFMASDFCWSVEMRRAIERHQAGAACVIPIIVRPADWSGAPFADLQVLPRHAKPVTQWQNRDAAWLDAVEGIRRAVAELGAGRRAGRPQQPAPSAPAASPAPSVAAAAATSGARAIHDAENGTVLSGRLVRAEGEPPADDPAVNEAYDALGVIRDFFAAVLDRDSIDGAGGPLVLTVHYGERYPNAFWTGTQMVVGDGDGVRLQRFTASPDVIGKQFANGVVQAVTSLEYWAQSGALLSSAGTIFAVLARQRALGQTAAEADWLFGAGLLMPGVSGVALESLKAPGTAYDDPSLGRDPQPSHMSGYVETDQDNGGVHVNAGIPNHAFYLAAAALGGHAWEVAGRVWYETLQDRRLEPDATFEQFARLTVDNAARLFGPDTVPPAITEAWEQVGVLGG